ncbi:MAG: acetate--CoA ligase [Flavisolibacter sp.]
MLQDRLIIPPLAPNLGDYNQFLEGFTWEKEKRNLSGLPGGGINMAHEAVDLQAEISPDRIAFRFLNKEMQVKDLTYKALKEQTNRFAQVLNGLGLLKGDTVSTLLGRKPELYITALGTLKKGCIYCPLFSVFGPEPVYHRLLKGAARVLVTQTQAFEKKLRPIWERLPELKYVLLTDAKNHLGDNIRSLPLLMEQASGDFTIAPTAPEDPALLHFTSGTTGLPKGALHVHEAILMHYMTGKYVLDFQKGDIFWCTADPGWVTGTSYGIIAPLVNGVTIIVDEEEFDAARWYSILEKQKITVWYTAPTAIRRLMRMDIRPLETYDLHHLRLILSVGEPLHAEAVLWGIKMLGLPILDNWWQTETGGIMIANYRSLPVRAGSMGKPLPGVEAAIADVSDSSFRILDKPGEQGHLVLKKGWPSMFRAYLHEEERYQHCFRGDWYITGDLAKKDADGYFWFVGRSDDIIKTSGHMVGPFEVERVLMSHEAVAEAAVIGKPDPLIGEMVKAFVILKTGFAAQEQTRQDIMGYARKKLGAAVAPKEIAFVNELPKTKSGKILRRLLKARELGLPEGDLSTLEQS